MIMRCVTCGSSNHLFSTYMDCLHSHYKNQTTCNIRFCHYTDHWLCMELVRRRVGLVRGDRYTHLLRMQLHSLSGEEKTRMKDEWKSHDCNLVSPHSDNDEYNLLTFVAYPAVSSDRTTFIWVAQIVRISADNLAWPGDTSKSTVCESRKICSEWREIL